MEWYNVWTSARIRIRWELVFIVIAGLSLTVGNTIYANPSLHIYDNGLDWLYLPSPPPYMRAFNRLLWLPHGRSGILPWDMQGFDTMMISIILFSLSVLWWAVLATLIDITINRLIPRLLYGRRRRGMA